MFCLNFNDGIVVYMSVSMACCSIQNSYIELPENETICLRGFRPGKTQPVS